MTSIGARRLVPTLTTLAIQCFSINLAETQAQSADDPWTEFVVAGAAFQDVRAGEGPTRGTTSTDADVTSPQSDDDDDVAKTMQLSEAFIAATTTQETPRGRTCRCLHCQCGCGTCATAQDPAMNAYEVLFYNNDFSYLVDDPGATTYFTDTTKGMRLGHDFTFDVGGAYRMRHHLENNMALSTLNAVDSEFLLQRTRLYANARIGDRFRLFAEMLDATSSYEDVPPRAIEENRADFINIFGDAVIWDTGDGKLTARGGRQELLYGAQRLVSPLDWANTRRTFDGAKLYWRGDNWDVDGFWTRPVPLLQHVPNDHNFDVPDLN